MPGDGPHQLDDAGPVETAPGGRRAPVPAERRPQQARSAETRVRLIEATLDVLMRHGYARTTTALIADMAGVSRGALTHHFEGKDDLVAQAVDHLLRGATAEIAALAQEVSSGRLAIGGFLDRLWEMFSGRLLLVTLEHVTEARHNAGLHAKLTPLVRDFHSELDAIWRAFFRRSSLSDAEVGAALNATLCLLRGMGVQTVLRDDPAYYRSLLALWKRQLDAMMSTPAAANAGEGDCEERRSRRIA